MVEDERWPAFYLRLIVGVSCVGENINCRFVKLRRKRRFKSREKWRRIRMKGRTGTQGERCVSNCRE